MSLSRPLSLLVFVMLYTACSGGGGGSTAPAKPGPPSQVIPASGNNQAVLAGTSASAITVKVADAKGLGVPAQTVTFSISAGGGTFSGGATTGTATTDANGLATVPTWTVGKSNVAQAITATSGALTGTVSAIISTNYEVKVIFFGGTAATELQTAFTYAAARLSAIIIGGPAPFTFPVSSANSAGINSGLAECGANVSVATGNITGVVIYARDTSSLGPGRIASAGPCLVRGTSQLTLFGVMVFSRAFLPPVLTQSQLNDAVLHEMTHVVGFNPGHWALLPDATPANMLIVNGGATPANASFRGAQAIAACLALPLTVASSCSPTIPLENLSGAGSDDSHWKESTFRSELMTPAISNGDSGHPFSKMTVGALADESYSTNPAAADAYTFGSSIMLNLNALRVAQGVVDIPFNDEVRRPVGSISVSGKLTRFQPKQ